HFTSSLDAVEFRHFDVRDDKIRAKCATQIQQLTATLSDALYAVAEMREGRQPILSHVRLVFGNNNAKRLSHASPRGKLMRIWPPNPSAPAAADDVSVAIQSSWPPFSSTIRLAIVMPKLVRSLGGHCTHTQTTGKPDM